MHRLTKREGRNTVRIGNECRRHDPVWDKLAYYEDLEEEGRLIILDANEEYPCKYCEIGWAALSAEGCSSCEDTCKRLIEYKKKYNK